MYCQDNQEWADAAAKLFRRFAKLRKGREFRFEDFRLWALDRGLEHPPVHQHWGLLPGQLRRMGLYSFTGRFEAAKSPRTHGHPVRVYKMLDC